MSQIIRRVTVCVTSLAGCLIVAPDVRAADTAEGARAVLQKYCYQCHGKDGRNEGGMNVVTDLRKLVESKRVIPGEPDRSKLLRRVTVGDMPPEIDFEDASENPKPLPRPTPAEIATLRAWIKEGAGDTAKQAAPRRFVSELDILKFIADDLQKINPRERKFTRYFTLTHLANAGYNEDQLQTYRHGLSKLINSLSWNRKIKVPTPIDPARSVLRIDLRDYLWDDGVWRSILDSYPYGVRHEGAAAAPVYELTASDLPIVRADWFVYAASRPPLYHEVLRLPATIEELERKLDVDAGANIRQDRVARAAFNASGVSRNNRLIERHESTNGGYWRSYDFAANADRKNIFAHPLGPGDDDQDFSHDGGETIFALPNGLQGYVLVDSHGRRIDKGPIQIVRDNKQADGAVVNGISCMSCHNRGLIEKADQLREVIEKTKAFDKAVLETVMVLYPTQERMNEYLHTDMDRFARAVKDTGAALSVTEPVFALATQFEEEMNVALAAAEAGLEVKAFQELLDGTPRLSQAMGLLLVGGTVKRDVFVDAFPMIAEGRHLRLLNPVAATAAVARAESLAPSRTSARVVVPPAARGIDHGPRASSAPVKSIARGGRPGYPSDRLSLVPDSFFGKHGPRFEDAGPAGSLLVGIRYSTHLFVGRPKVSSVQPLYRASATSPTLIEGETHGDVTSALTTTVARPGYAVGAIRTRTGLSLDGVVIMFMKVNGDKLDTSDWYESPVLGDSQGGSPAFVTGNGSLVVGLQGYSTKNVNALGLILAK
jgi:hypothetical protein